MAKTGLITVLALTLAIAGCGSTGRGTTNINGNWTATLINTDGSLAYQFSATFTQGSDDNLTITNLTFTTPGACDFVAAPAQGSFTPANRAFAMSMAELNVGGDMLALQGTLSDSTISGTWSASGLVPPCSGNGSFTIKPMAG